MTQEKPYRLINTEGKYLVWYNYNIHQPEMKFDDNEYIPCTFEAAMALGTMLGLQIEKVDKMEHFVTVLMRNRRTNIYRAKPTESAEKLKEYGFFVDNDGFIYGDIIEDNMNCYIVQGVAECTDEYIGINRWSPVVPETVSQYTGVDDKFDVPIFSKAEVKIRLKDDHKKQLTGTVFDLPGKGFTVLVDNELYTKHQILGIEVI